MRRDGTQISAWQGLRGGGNGEKLLDGRGVFYWSLVNVLEPDRGKWWLHDAVNVLIATGLFTLKWSISCYVNFT